MKDITYYKNLITSEYRLSPKFMAWLEGGLKAANDTNASAESIIAAFDIDNAIGMQLDILGILIGRKRTVDFQPKAGMSPVLDDSNYRLALKAKIIWNQWKGTLPEIQDAWSNLFPNGYIIIFDNQDMTMDALIVGDFSQMEKDLIDNGYIIPKPAGVRINFIVIASTDGIPLFSYGYDNEILGGYDTTWFNMDRYKVFGYGEETDEIAGYDTGYWA